MAMTRRRLLQFLLDLSPCVTFYDIPSLDILEIESYTTLISMLYFGYFVLEVL